LSSWRDQILKEFSPKIAQLTLVADPDGLLLEEGILQEIRDRGFEVVSFEDHISFRYTYESRFRSQWDQGENVNIIVILRSTLDDLDILPYDLLQIGRKLSFSLIELFPTLSNFVIAELDRSELDTLYQAIALYEPGHIGNNATKEFVLRHVFEIAPELIKQASDLLRVLLRIHYRNQQLPTLLSQYFISMLRKNRQFHDWPLEQIVPTRQMFYTFLQERWSIFLDCLVKAHGTNISEDVSSFGLEIPGPALLPFEHDDIRVYIDNLFIEGMLSPISYAAADKLNDEWVEIGILSDLKSDHLQRLLRLLNSIQETIPAEDAKHVDWLRFGYVYSEMSVLEHTLGGELSGEIGAKIASIRKSVDELFQKWIQKRFAGLQNQPPVPPVMLHHIPRLLARKTGDSPGGKVAFLLIDGLALDQWIILRETLQTQRPKLTFNESAVFAWIPSTTSVSRQAAFSGKPPAYFPNSITTTNKEQSLWIQFWSDEGLGKQAILYERGLGDGSLDHIREKLSNNQIQVAGLIVNKVDKIMHGMELGAAGMHNQVRQWGDKGYLTKLVDILLDLNFQIILSSDHGNIEANGYGRPTEGSVADLKGERVRVYPDILLRTSIKERFPDALEWPSTGLPDDYCALLAPYRKAFIQKNETIVGHGGISVEELIVPLIHIERSGN